MIKKNLSNDMMIRNFLNQYEVTEKISDLCNMTINISLNLHIKQKTNLNFSDQSVLTENFYINLSRKIKIKIQIQQISSVKFFEKLIFQDLLTLLMYNSFYHFYQ